MNVLTKGDNNPADDRGSIYNYGKMWLHEGDLVGQVVGYAPYVGIVTILMNDYPALKVGLLLVLAYFTLNE